MTNKSAVRRKLFMHSAHATIGVSGDRSTMAPYCLFGDVSTDGQAVARRLAAVAACPRNADTLAAIRMFEKTVHRWCDIQCRRVDFDEFDAEFWNSTDFDCVVLFRRGFLVARHWSDICSGLAADDPDNDKSEPVEVEIIPAGQRHPVLEGVEPFVSRQVEKKSNSHGDDRLLPTFPANATPLLIGRTAGGIQPAAWIEHTCRGDVFHTTLGAAEDFSQPDFVRLALNAVMWIGK